MCMKTSGIKLESNNHVIYVVFFPLIFENDGSLTTNDEEIIIVFVQNLILSKKIFLFILLVYFVGKKFMFFNERFCIF
jgi:hypothetical protein